MKFWRSLFQIGCLVVLAALILEIARMIFCPKEEVIRNED
jgi:hypothetical protein